MMKIKTLALITLLIICKFRASSQDLNEKEIIGTWKVLKIQVEPNNPFSADKKAELEILKSAFLKSVFYFKEDHNFTFNLEIDDLKITKAHWKYEEATKSYLIQEWKDKNLKKPLLMEITTKKIGDKIIFMISESFFELEVRKE